VVPSKVHQTNCTRIAKANREVASYSIIVQYIKVRVQYLILTKPREANEDSIKLDII